MEMTKPTELFNTLHYSKGLANMSLSQWVIKNFTHHDLEDPKPQSYIELY